MLKSALLAFENQAATVIKATAGRGSTMVVLTVGGNAGKARRVLGR